MVVLEGKLDKIMMNTAICIGNIQPTDGKGLVFFPGILDHGE